MQAITTIGLESRSRSFRFMASMRRAMSSSAVSSKRRYVLAFFQKLPPCLDFDGRQRGESC
jgi:hypothetical protein